MARSGSVAPEQGLLQTFPSRQIDSVCSCWLWSCLLCVPERENLPSVMQGLHVIFLELGQSAKSAGAFWKRQEPAEVSFDLVGTSLNLS